MERVLVQIYQIRKMLFPQLHTNPHMFAVKGVGRGYVHGSKGLEFVCQDLGLRRIVTAGMIRRFYATKAVFEANSKNQRL